MSVRLHNLALAQRAHHALLDVNVMVPRGFLALNPTATELHFRLDALTPADLAHMAAHSRPVAEVSP